MLQINNLQIGLAAWIIQDGNYSEFTVGQEAKFALEFYPHSLSTAQPGTLRFEAIGPALYSIYGRVDFVHKETWVIDFGLLAYEETKPPDKVTFQSWIRANIYLGIDPFPYFERLQGLPGMPVLTYRWLIKRIQLETTPWIVTPSQTIRDTTKTSFREVEKTDAWYDDGGHANYIFDCEYLGQI
jgi:hypothetical protein